jgi:tRNA(Ile)-lysidine synthase TilS/MesJ
MVIAKILALLRSHFNLRELFSMHIDYSNRDESKQEAAFVRDWAERHGFTHFERVISEVKRGVTDRAEYEKISRNLRYGFYKEILTTHMGWIDQEHAHGEGEGGVGGLECGLGVIFGHHAGDVQENVLSNIMRGCSPLSLAGMHEVGITEGVPVWRPLLKHVKEEIFEFAHR